MGLSLGRHRRVSSALDGRGFSIYRPVKPAIDHWSFGYETGKIAYSIVSGHGFSNPMTLYTGPTAMLTPVYPYLVAAIFKLFGIYSKASAIVLLSLNSLFSALTCVPVYFIAQRSFGNRSAKIAAWIWAFFPYAIFLSASMIWETCLTTLLLCLILWSSFQLDDATGLSAWMGWGLLFGITGLTNPAVLLLFPLLLGRICYRRSRDKREWVVRALASLLVVVVTLLPWQLRNKRDVWALSSPTGHFLVGDVDRKPRRQLFPLDEPNSPSDRECQETRQFLTLGEVGYMEQKRRLVLAFIGDHPGWFAIQTARRFAYTWTGVWGLPQHPIGEPFDPDEPFDPAHIVFCTALSGLAFFGLRRAFVERSELRWIYASVLASFPVIYYVTVPHVRYRHPMDPLITILAAYACSQWRARAAWRERGPRV